MIRWQQQRCMAHAAWDRHSKETALCEFDGLKLVENKKEENMRNLQVVQHSCLRFFDNQEIRTARLFCIDNENIRQSVYFFCDGNRMFVAQFGINEARLCCDFGSEGLISSAEVSNKKSDFHIIGVQYLFGHSTICVASKHGEILMYNTITEEVDCVGIIETGITTMSWSPDQDLVVFITGSDTLILMTRVFELLLEVPVHSEDIGENKPVTIGWGNKETQFHGSEGKGAAKQKLHEMKSVFDWDDRRTRVSWRGDGTAFATSTVTPLLSYRQLRVWTREGVHQSTSEYVAGLEQSMCWQPSGSLIATSLRTCDGNKHEIAFFERNCLQHGSFTLRSNGRQSVKVNEVLWNTDSSLLAVWLENLPNMNADSTKTSCVRIYSTNNYHWYLKQCFQYGRSANDEDITVRWLQWDTESAFVLHVLTSNGIYSRYTFLWTTDCSMNNGITDNSTVYVVDGETVLVTPFRNVVVPPPMSAYAFELHEPINGIVVGPKSCSNDFIAVTASNQLHFFSKDDRASVMDDTAANLKRNVTCLENYHQLIGVAKISWPDILHAVDAMTLLYHWIWHNATTMLFVVIGTDNINELCIADVETSLNAVKCAVTVRKIIPLMDEVCKLCATSNENEVLIQFSDGRVTRYNYDVANSLSSNDVLTSLRFQQPLSAMEHINIDGQEHVIMLSNSFGLYVDSTQVSDQCTSLAFNGDFIVFTTFDHILHCLPISFLRNAVLDAKMLISKTVPRAVERGSRIVTVVSKDTKVILQMPRGNLEVIHPRSLILHSIKENLDQVQYKTSLLIMRRHRIDMNLLYDHNPSMFMQNADTFIEQVDDVVLINLFLSSLRNEDVTKTVYKLLYTIENDDVTTSSFSEGKVNLICDIVRLQMEKASEDKYFLGILTAHAVKKEPEIDLALMKIKHLRDLGPQDKHLTTPETALRHLLCLVDVDNLYKVALGTYDFDLVLMVAEKSQKDPKEYLPYLNELKEMDSNYQKYSIDIRLNRYTRALEHISKCGDERFEECIALIKEHNLYTQGLKCFQQDSPPWKAIINVQASHLMSKQQYDEAGLTYLLGGFLHEALQSFKRCGNWRRALCVAHQLALPLTDIVQLAQYLAEQIKSNSRFVEAAEILEHYVKDYEGAIGALIDARLWDSALLMIHRHNRLDMINCNLRPALTNQSSSVIATLDQEIDRFSNLKSRLLVVRVEHDKQNKHVDEDVFLADSDMYSETSSMTGISGQSWATGTESRFTSQTSRRKKKMERKKVTLKKGSPFEDIALLESLTETIMRVDSMKEECGQLVQALILHGFQKEALFVQKKLEDVICQIINSKADIWPPTNDLQESSHSIKFGPMATANSAVAQTKTNAGITRRNIPQEYLAFMQPPSLRSGIKWKLESLKDLE